MCAKAVPAQSNGRDIGLAQGTRRLLRSPTLQAAGLCLLVGLPLVLMACHIMLSPQWPEPLPDGDEAMLELATWHALHGTQLGGPCSHRVFRNPGPIQFYVTAPLYWLTGCKYDGICLTACLINLAAIAGVLVVAGRCAGRTGLIWSALLLTLYVASLDKGSLVLSWGAVVTIMPFVLTVILFAAVATGRLGYLPAAVLVSSYLVQTYVAYLPALATVAALSLLLCAVPKLRSGSGTGGPGPGNVPRILLICLLVLVLAWALPVIREITAQSSDISKLVGFFGEHGVCHSWREALGKLPGVLSAFPLSCVGGNEAAVWHGEKPWLSAIVAGGQLLLLPAACWLARREGRDFELVLSLLCIALLGAFAVSIQRIVGPIYEHMIRWMATVSLLILLAAGGVFLPWLGRVLRVEAGPGRRCLVGVIALTAIGLRSALNAKEMLNAIPAIHDDVTAAKEVRPLFAACRHVLQERRVRRYLVRIVDYDVWPSAAALVLQMTKAGFLPAVDPDWVLTFGPQHAPIERAEGVFLLCNSRSAARLRRQEGMELVAETQQVSLYWRRSTHRAQSRDERQK